MLPRDDASRRATFAGVLEPDGLDPLCAALLDREKSSALCDRSGLLHCQPAHYFGLPEKCGHNVLARALLDRCCLQISLPSLQ